MATELKLGGLMEVCLIEVPLYVINGLKGKRNFNLEGLDRGSLNQGSSLIFPSSELKCHLSFLICHCR